MPLLCKQYLDRLLCRFIFFIHLHCSMIDDFEPLVQFTSEQCLHLNVCFRALPSIFALVIFHEVICHRSPNGGAMPTLDALVPRFHRDSTYHSFQHNCVFFPSPDRIECHQSVSSDDRIQSIICTIDLVVVPSLCLKIFQWYPPVAACTNDPFHFFID